MNRPRLRGAATAAAALPAALSAAVLVSAPFAGTTTEPLAHSQPLAGANARTANTSQAPPAPNRSHGGHGLSLDVSAAGVAALAGFEVCLLGVAAGVIVTVRRRATGDQQH